jgi:hypothetical protein
LISLEAAGESTGGERFEPTLTLTKVGSGDVIAATSVGFRSALAFVAPQLLEANTN